jgi:galactose-1-phosphate uridylyltransferase
VEIFIKRIVQFFFEKLKLENKNYSMGYFKNSNKQPEISLKELAKNHRIKELKNYCNLDII